VAHGESTLAAKHIPVSIPDDLDSVLDRAWQATRNIPGHLGEQEARFLGMLAACIPATGTPVAGVIVEIGSFKGRSTVMLATVSAHYNLPPVVSIDPHNSPVLLNRTANANATSYDEFLHSIHSAGVAANVEVHRAYSSEVAANWAASSRPIRLLWIDGDHTYAGAKQDLDTFLPYVQPGGVVAFHDSLHEFPGPIRVFVEDILCSPQFGTAGFVHSIAWSQFRPADGERFTSQRAVLARFAAPLAPLLSGLQDGEKLYGLAKLRYKLKRSRVPRSAVSPRDWAALIENAPS
jgi:predicted O-methyltransferase YrrM